jgi:hypothetical protein
VSPDIPEMFVPELIDRDRIEDRCECNIYPLYGMYIITFSYYIETPS